MAPNKQRTEDVTRGRSSARTHFINWRRNRNSRSCDESQDAAYRRSISSTSTDDAPRSLSPSTRTSANVNSKVSRALLQCKQTEHIITTRVASSDNTPRSLSPSSRTSIYATKLVKSQKKNNPSRSSTKPKRLEVDVSPRVRQIVKSKHSNEPGSRFDLHHSSKMATSKLPVKQSHGSDLRLATLLSSATIISDSSLTCDTSTTNSCAASINEVSPVTSKPNKVKVPRNIIAGTKMDPSCDNTEISHRSKYASRNESADKPRERSRVNSPEFQTEYLYQCSHNQTDKKLKITWEPYVSVSTGELVMNTFYTQVSCDYARSA